MDLTVIIVAVACVIAFLSLGTFVASRYKRVAPNCIGIFYGRTYKVKDVTGNLTARGFKIITGGGAILYPVVERYQEMSTSAFQVNITETNVPTKKNVPVNIGGTATCRVSQNPDEQPGAVQAFLGKEEREIEDTIKSILRGHMRTIIAQLDIEEILRDRATFNQKVLSESSEEFKKLGIQIITLVVHDVNDANGYIEALGKQETAAKIRDAEIALAQAKRDTEVKISELERESKAVQAKNITLIAEAEKDKNLQIAAFKTETETKRAKADMAFNIANAEQEKTLKIAEADRDAKNTEAQIVVQEKQALLTKSKLNATLITEAKARQEAQIIDAEAKQQVAERTAKMLVIEADGRRNAAIKEGDGLAQKTKLVAEGDSESIKLRAIATAEGEKAGLIAKADGERANLFAHAEALERRLNAEALGKKNSLLAEAEGTLELANALKQLNEQGKLILILDRLPNLLEKGGDAGAKMLEAIFTPLGNSMASIKNVSIVDMGSNRDGSGIEKIAGSIPSIVTDFVVKAKASGLDITKLLGLIGVDASKLGNMMGGDNKPFMTDIK